MNAYGPAAIGVDIVMPEPDPFSPERVLSHANVGLALLEQIAELPSNDAELATAFRVAPVVAVLAGAPATAGESAPPMRVAPMLVRDAGSTRFEVGPGQSLCIPRGAVHRFDNHGDANVKALCVISPAAIGPEFFRESAEVINAATAGPPDRVKMAEIMRRHGLTPAPAP